VNYKSVLITNNVVKAPAALTATLTSNGYLAVTTPSVTTLNVLPEAEVPASGAVYLYANETGVEEQVGAGTVLAATQKITRAGSYKLITQHSTSGAYVVHSAAAVAVAAFAPPDGTWEVVGSDSVTAGQVYLDSAALKYKLGAADAVTVNLNTVLDAGIIGLVTAAGTGGGFTTTGGAVSAVTVATTVNTATIGGLFAAVAATDKTITLAAASGVLSVSASLEIPTGYTLVLKKALGAQVTFAATSFALTVNGTIDADAINGGGSFWTAFTISNSGTVVVNKGGVIKQNTFGINNGVHSDFIFDGGNDAGNITLGSGKTITGAWKFGDGDGYDDDTIVLGAAYTVAGSSSLTIPTGTKVEIGAGNSLAVGSGGSLVLEPGAELATLSNSTVVFNSILTLEKEGTFTNTQTGSAGTASGNITITSGSGTSAITGVAGSAGAPALTLGATAELSIAAANTLTVTDAAIDATAGKVNLTNQSSSILTLAKKGASGTHDVATLILDTGNKSIASAASASVNPVGTGFVAANSNTVANDIKVVATNAVNGDGSAPAKLNVQDGTVATGAGGGADAGNAAVLTVSSGDVIITGSSGAATVLTSGSGLKVTS
jgi:hypothetical protein